MGGKIVEADRPQMTKWRCVKKDPFACLLIKARIQTGTHNI
jgi:hypothetical protein